MIISKGKIIQYDSQRLFGFIQPEGNPHERGADVFFHIRDLDTMGFTDIEEHSNWVASMLNTPHKVEYLTRIRWKVDKDTGEERGRLCAKEVEIYLT